MRGDEIAGNEAALRYYAGLPQEQARREFRQQVQGFVASEVARGVPADQALDEAALILRILWRKNVEHL